MTRRAGERKQEGGIATWGARECRLRHCSSYRKDVIWRSERELSLGKRWRHTWIFRTIIKVGEKAARSRRTRVREN